MKITTKNIKDSCGCDSNGLVVKLFTKLKLNEHDWIDPLTITDQFFFIWNYLGFPHEYRKSIGGIHNELETHIKYMIAFFQGVSILINLDITIIVKAPAFHLDEIWPFSPDWESDWWNKL